MTSHELNPSLPYFCVILLVIFFTIQPVIAANNKNAAALAMTNTNNGIDKQSQNNRQIISSYDYGFDGVYSIELLLDIPANIEVLSKEKAKDGTDTINVRIEQSRIENSIPFSHISSEHISLTGVNTDGTLQLNTKLTDDTQILTSENRGHSQIYYSISTPPDVSLKLSVKKGNIHIHNIRGKFELTNEMGNVNFFETLGIYDVNVSAGNIKGNILFTPGQSDIKTEEGSIELIVLDTLAVPMNLTAHGGGIRLLIPKDYPSDIEYESVKQQVIINVPAEIDHNSGFINGGGPLLRLKSMGAISILPAPTLQGTSPDSQISSDTDADIENIPSETNLQVRQTPIAPYIDGNLSETAWFNATKLSPFLNPDGTQEVENQTKIYLMWDEKNLYIGGKAYFSDLQVPRVSQTQLDSPIWEDECVEILLDMNPVNSVYSHLIINPIAAVYDQQVKTVGFPSNKYFPKEVKRKSISDSIVKFNADSKWNSNAIVGTQIYSSYWSFEIAFPRRPEVSISKKSMLFNVHRKLQANLRDGGNIEPVLIRVHRKLQANHRDDGNIEPVLIREYSYWQPHFDKEQPWWPHWIEGMGTLKLVENLPSNSDPFDITDNMKVTSVEITGNNVIPTAFLLHQIPIKQGDIVSSEELGWMLSELRNYNLFKDVQLMTVPYETESAISASPQLPSEPIISESSNPETNTNNIQKQDEPSKVILQLKVEEKNVLLTRNIKIEGNKSFPAQFIKDWFNLSHGFMISDDIKIKQQMITTFYKTRGFPFAKTSYKFDRETLQLDINEGYLDEIRFTGNRQISDTALLSALDIDKGSVFFHSLGQSRINKLRDKLKKTNEDFESIRDWSVQKEGGRNILIINIEEQPLISPGWYPIVDFNRVHGLVIGGGGTLSSNFIGGEQVFGSASRGFSSERWNYQFGIEKTLIKSFPITLGVGLFRLTDTSSKTFRFRPTEIGLLAAVYGTDLENYYERSGEQFWITKWIGKSSQFQIGFSHEKHSNLSKSTDWSYYNRNQVKIGNQRIETGIQNKISARYSFDTRDKKSIAGRSDNFGIEMYLWPHERTRRGWRGNIGIQMVGNQLGGDYTYSLYTFELNRYTPIVGLHNINFRVAGDFSDTSLPQQHLLYLGGATTLRGFHYNSFAGDNRFLFNVEYRLINEVPIDANFDAAIGMSLSIFMDTGKTWWYGQSPFSDFSLRQLDTSVGVGISFFIIPDRYYEPFSASFEIALPISDTYFLKTYPVILRLERMF